jgi:5-methylcytosine-specific restriction endonuclease McrA
MKCLACGSANTERAHIKSRGSGGSDDAWNIMALCRKDHQEQHKIGIITFIEKYPEVKTYVEQNGWQIDNVNSFKRLVRK